MKCAIAHCQRDAVKFAMCVPCCLTWLLTPGARLQGQEKRAALQDFVTRQDVRHALKE